MNHTELIQSLRHTLLDALKPAFAGPGPFVLIDYPDSANAGDHAIWIGEKIFLKTLGIEVAYQCSLETYDKVAMAKALAAGTILMHGGGNFGDTYIFHQFRHKVLTDFPNNKVVIFPQTAMFFTDIGIRQSAEYFAAHADVTIAVRDVLSFHILKKSFSPRHRIILAPDMAFMLQAQTQRIKPTFGIVWLSRTDFEGVYGDTILKTVEPKQLHQQNIHLGRHEDGIPAVAKGEVAGSMLLVTDWYRCTLDQKGLAQYQALDFDQRSLFWLRRASRILSLGHVVITDRLHAHILCTLAGIPHILLNNSYGKNVSFFETWCRPLDLCQLARSAAEAWALAQQFLVAQNISVRA